MNLPEFEVGKTTIGQLLDHVAMQFSDDIALAYHRLKISDSYLEFRDKCNKVAKGLMAIGIQKGDHIAIWANNVPQWVYTQFGSAKAGAVLVTVNTNYREYELEYLMKQSDATTLLMVGGVRDDKEYLDIVYRLCPELKIAEPGRLNSEKLPNLKNVVFLGHKKLPGMFTWEEILASGENVSDEALGVREAALAPDDVINMQYTSGTTGFPKGVMLSHTNLIGNAKSIAERLRFSSSDKLCIPVPFFHCFGCVLGTLTCVVSAATMCPVESFKADKVLKTIQELKCTAVHGVPTMFIAELEEMDNRHYDTASLRTGIMAGSPCPIEVMKAVVHKMGASEMTIVYGQTESSPGITQTRTSDPLELRVGTVGSALPNVEVKIISIDGYSEMAPGEQGELCTRGYHVMKGYYKMEDETRNAIDQEGWLHTGDLAVMDKNGYVRITGRVKDMIIRGGENIYPREIEEFLYTHPGIKDVQVVGIPDDKYGEEVVAFIQLKQGKSVTEDELRKFCKERISYFKIPAHFFFIAEYPTTASGKVQKYKLRKMAIDAINQNNIRPPSTLVSKN